MIASRSIGGGEAMRRTLICTGLAVGLLLGCSDDSATKLDAAQGSDAKAVTDSSQTADSPGQDAAADAQVADLSSGDGGAVTCTPSTDNCTGGLKCHCCGSIGPAPICICTTTCAGNGDCTRPNQPLCNKASPSAAAGICTPAGYNCCWMCQ
jgi:hypothetical protein